MSTTISPTTRTVDGVELPPAGAYDLDAGHTNVGFVVRHLMVAKTRGRFADVHGSVTIGEDPRESSLQVEIGAASVDTGDDTRDAHLRSADFLDAEQFPVLAYHSRSVRPAGNGHWTVDGDLTVHGVTKPVALDVVFEGGVADPWGNVRAGFSASAEIDREAFGLTWNQALESGGVLVGKKAAIEIEAELVQHS
jgi:polyisoprenoid-binding protein YceI